MKAIPKKSLGQNFLIDRNIIEKIIKITKIQNKNILEIGPGTGNLTEYILQEKPNYLTVIEKDENLCQKLLMRFKDKIKIINNDILKENFEVINSNKKFTVFGNLPYNISTEIICRWVLNLKENYWFDELVLMFQKEVADRIIAKENTSQFGRLAILMNWRLNIKKVFDIGPNSFSPKPKIDSSVLHFSPKNNFQRFKNSKSIEIVTRTFFNQRRKMIKNPLKQLFKNPKEISNKLNIDLNLRPQNLSILKFYEIISEYEKLRS
ncbi:dimethyladenosine transferase [alpha proteobacterium HIMB5]|nr:dimethyladenosine transferase [alpha proteobacterium HIMB5]